MLHECCDSLESFFPVVLFALLIILLKYFSSIFQYKMPTPEGLRPEIKDNHDGSISVQYTPSIQGRHEVQMCYEGAAIDGEYVLSCTVLYVIEVT